MFRNLLRAFGPALATLALLLMIAAASAQPAHQHPPRDAEVHEKFYMGWDRPDFPGNNCCKLSDCYVTAIKRVGNDHYALTRTIVKDEQTGVATNEYRLNDPKGPAKLGADSTRAAGTESGAGAQGILQRRP